MATFHLSVKSGGKDSAHNHSKYITRAGYYGNLGKQDLIETGHGNMPAWADDNPSFFWRSADRYERMNAAVYREIVVALPRELPASAQFYLVTELIESALNGRPYQFAIHCPKGSLSQDDQPHAHIMFSDRADDGIERLAENYFSRYNANYPERGGSRKLSGGKSMAALSADLRALRKLWADLINKALCEHGYPPAVDHRSLEERGIGRRPERHLGANRISQMPISVRFKLASSRPGRNVW